MVEESQRDADDAGNDGTNSFRISRASSMLFLASFSARRALTSSKPSATSRPRLWSIAAPVVSAESMLAVAPTGAWCRAGSGGTEPSGMLTD